MGEKDTKRPEISGRWKVGKQKQTLWLRENTRQVKGRVALLTMEPEANCKLVWFGENRYLVAAENRFIFEGRSREES